MLVWFWFFYIIEVLIMSNKIELSVLKVKRSWCVMAGSANLGKFKSEELAKQSIIDDYDFYEYWAGSAGVLLQNAEPVIKVLN